MIKATITFLCAAFLVGCGGTHPNFYTLSTDGPVPSSKGLGIGVGPVILTEYVNRQNLVIETGPNKIEVSEHDLWAGSLDQSIARVLSVNLGRRLGTSDIRTYPWQRDSELDYQIAVDVHDFIGGDDGYARIEASWRAYALPARNLAASGTFRAKEAIAQEDFESVVAAQSRLLSRLSSEIAQKIRRR